MNDYKQVSIREVPSYYWKEDQTITTETGEVLPWYEAVQKYPNLGVWVNEEGRPATKKELTDYARSFYTQDQLDKADAEEIKQKKADENPIANQPKVKRVSDYEALFGDTRVKNANRAWKNSPEIMQSFKDANDFVGVSTIGAFALGSGLAGNALKWTNTLMTPSTYTDLIGLPYWLGSAANAGVSSDWLYDSGKKFIEDPSLENGIFTAMSLIPATRAGTDDTVNLISKGIGENISKISQKISKVYNKNQIIRQQQRAFNKDRGKRALFGAMILNDGEAYGSDFIPNLFKTLPNFFGYTFTGKQKYLQKLAKVTENYPGGYDGHSGFIEPINIDILTNSPYELYVFPEKFEIGQRVFNAGSKKGPILVDTEVSPGTKKYFEQNYPSKHIRTVQLFPGKDQVDFKKLHDPELFDYLGTFVVESSRMRMPKLKGTVRKSNYSYYDSAGTDVSAYRDRQSGKIYYFQEDRAKFLPSDYIKKYAPGPTQLLIRPITYILDKLTTPYSVRGNIRELSKITKKTNPEDKKVLDTLTKEGIFIPD